MSCVSIPGNASLPHFNLFVELCACFFVLCAIQQMLGKETGEIFAHIARLDLSHNSYVQHSLNIHTPSGPQP